MNERTIATACAPCDFGATSKKLTVKAVIRQTN